MNRTMYPVDVISMCSANGDIFPLRLRIVDENQQHVRVDIEEIMSCKKIQYVGNESHVFVCRATVHEKPWLFQLKYAIRNHNWTLMNADSSAVTRI